MNRALINADEGDSDVEEDETKQYIYMELESTQSGLADMDLEAMFSSSTVDDFMHNLARKGSFASSDDNFVKQKSQDDAMDLISNIMSGKKIDGPAKAEAPKL